MANIAALDQRVDKLSAGGVPQPVLLADHVELDKAAFSRQGAEHLDIGSLIDMPDNEARGIDPLRFQNLQLLYPDRAPWHLLPPPAGRVAGDGNSGPPLGNRDGFETLQLQSFDPGPV